MTNKEFKARVANAFRAMKAIGIKEDKVKPVLKNLLKLHNKNWAPIEEGNYRALADAISEKDELGAEEYSKKNVQDEEEAQATEEPERPLKRLRQRDQDGQNASLNTSNSSVPRTPPVRTKEEPHELSETHLLELNDPQGNLKSPQLNNEKTMPKPQAAVTKGKKPISSKSLVIHDLEGDDPCQNSVSGSRQGTQLRPESRSQSHAMKLRDRSKGAASLEILPQKRPVPEGSSHAVPLKEPKGELDILSSPKKNKTSSRASIKPKDEPIADEVPCLEASNVIANTVTPNGGDSLSRNDLLRENLIPEPSTLQWVSEKETDDGTAKLNESPSLEIASSASGEVEISLSYKLAPGRRNFHMPSLEAVLKSVEDGYLRSPNTLEPKIPMMNLMKEICESFLKLGTDSYSQSRIMESTATINSMSRSSVAYARNARCLRSGAKVPLSKSVVLSLPCYSINGKQQLDKSDARDEIVINRENQKNTAKEMSGLSLVAVQQPQLAREIRRACHDIVDITKGHENVVIALVNEVNDEPPPSFNYIPQNAVFQNAYMNFSLARIGDNVCCAACSGDCLSLSIPCACSYETGGEFAYTSDGLVKEEFLKECISMNRDDPKEHCQYFCKECPLERSKCDDSIEPCKGHLVRRFIKECWRKCGCNKQCGNRVVQRGITRKLQVFMTPEGKGWGLRTLEDLPKGAFVCEYVGEVLTNAELFERVLRSPEGEKHSYPVLLDADWCAEGVLKDDDALCLDATYYGNVARFINHKCYDSNLVEIPVEVETPDHHYYHLAFFTTRKVKAMEELTWDYGIDFDDNEHPIKAFRCQCGSKFCRNIKRSRSRSARR